MAHVMSKAQAKLRSVIVTLLDLKNAFREVCHNLIRSVLAHHSIPESVRALIASLISVREGVAGVGLQPPSVEQKFASFGQLSDRAIRNSCSFSDYSPDLFDTEFTEYEFLLHPRLAYMLTSIRVLFQKALLPLLFLLYIVHFKVIVLAILSSAYVLTHISSSLD